MKVKELIEQLKLFDEEQEVCIAEIQNYGSNFTYKISSVEEQNKNSWYNGKSYKAVMIIGEIQDGTMSREEDEE